MPLQFALDNPGALSRLKFLIGVFSMAHRKKLAVSFERRLQLPQFIQNDGAQEPIAGCILT
jgi:hypothetical protein